ncbi:MAG: 1-deoxy-D-xylulose-5-phosphate reductoisomerase [Actinobacteria bacterium]|nr:1-deoxy-D-xylulose-5-phosphate reductoisomerase [Actinomycetota bacterium]
MAVKKIAIFGSTGSIGRQALEVISHYRNEFEIVLLTGYKNYFLLKEQALEFNARYISTPDAQSFESLKDDPQVGYKLINFKQATELIRSEEVEVVLNALVGASGLKITIASILSAKTLLLANKESLVIGGGFIQDYLPNWRKFVIPVDSEHSAIFQALLGEQIETVSQIILTASGGPFFNLSLEELEKVTSEDALKHPTWKMGQKITIDSATLMNKGLEVIEAHYLFNIPYEKIKVVIHRQSIVHGMILFSDGTIKAVLSKPDMRLPIEYALFYPQRREQIIDPLPYSNMTLEFERPDNEKFPALNLAYEAGKRGGNMPVILNAANEVAVRAFLSGSIKFTDISKVVERTLSSFTWRKMESIKDIVETDQTARTKAISIIKEMKI